MANPKLLCAVVVGTLGLVGCSKQGSSPESENATTAQNDVTTVETVQDPTSPGAMASDTTSGMEPGAIGTPGTGAGTGTGPGMTGTSAGAGTTTAAASTAPTAAPLTDAQIMKVAAAVDQGEIEQSKEVQKKAKNPQVKKLAQHMIQQHTKSQKKQATLAKKAQLTPEESPVSSELTTTAQQALDSIKAASAPADAERAYIDAQVKQHETVLELLNTRLIPSAVNADLKAQLEETRSMVENHIEEARKVQQALSEGATGAAPTAG